MYISEVDNVEEVVYAINVPSKEHGRSECIEAKEDEINNILNFGTFTEVNEINLDFITRKWVITEKENHDDMKQ